MYEFSSKSQQFRGVVSILRCCLRYCKCTSFQANHNRGYTLYWLAVVVCDTANVRVFKQITTDNCWFLSLPVLFAILQMYEFSSKSQLIWPRMVCHVCCLRYCKCTSFQANHNWAHNDVKGGKVVCDTANVRVFKQITTSQMQRFGYNGCLRYCKCTSFQANHNWASQFVFYELLFAILQMYEFSSKSQHDWRQGDKSNRCLRYCKCTSFQANHNWDCSKG